MDETYHGMQACQSSPDSQTSKARLSDWTIDHSLVTEPIQKTFRDLVSISHCQMDFDQMTDVPCGTFSSKM